MASWGSSCCSEVVAALLASAVLAAPAELHTRRIEFADLPPPTRGRLAARGIDASRFEEQLRRVEASTAERLRQGERDSLVYYALQSRRFTDAPGIEPALSAREFVEHLPEEDRRRLLDDGSYLPAATLPKRERERIQRLLQAVRSPSTDPRLVSFRDLAAAHDATVSADAFYPDFVRVARFLYRKEFVAAADGSSANAATSRLYQDRAHSSDTRVEAGFAVYVGLASLGALDPALRLPRVLVVGPGLDFAPRTDLVDSVEPQSYQPFAVADALLSLSLASTADLRVESVDVNGRVVNWLDALVPEHVTIHFLTGIRRDRGLLLRDDYRAYLRSLGRAIGDESSAPRGLASDAHYVRSIVVRPAVVRALGATRLNLLTERIAGDAGFDLIVATNVLAYFDDAELDLALANMTAMLRPGGYLLHNESRAGLVEQATAIGLPAVHMRTAVIGGPSDRPLYDAVWIHRRSITR